MDTEESNPARRIEVVFGDADRKLAVDLPDGHGDRAANEVADHLVTALGTDDPDEAERGLTAGVSGIGAVRRLG